MKELTERELRQAARDAQQGAMHRIQSILNDGDLTEEEKFNSIEMSISAGRIRSDMFEARANHPIQPDADPSEEEPK